MPVHGVAFDLIEDALSNGFKQMDLPFDEVSPHDVLAGCAFLVQRLDIAV